MFKYKKMLAHKRYFIKNARCETIFLSMRDFIEKCVDLF